MSHWSKAESPIACDMGVLSPVQREMHFATSRELGLLGNVIDWDAIDWNRGRMRRVASEKSSEKGSEAGSE